MIMQSEYRKEFLILEIIIERTNKYIYPLSYQSSVESQKVSLVLPTDLELRGMSLQFPHAMRQQVGKGQHLPNLGGSGKWWSESGQVIHTLVLVSHNCVWFTCFHYDLVNIFQIQIRLLRFIFLYGQNAWSSKLHILFYIFDLWFVHFENQL